MPTADDRDLEIDRLRREADRLITSLKLHIQIDDVKYGAIRSIPHFVAGAIQEPNVTKRRVKT